MRRAQVAKDKDKVMQIVQMHRHPWGDNDWDTLDLSETVLYLVVNLEPGGGPTPFFSGGSSG